VATRWGSGLPRRVGLSWRPPALARVWVGRSSTAKAPNTAPSDGPAVSLLPGACHVSEQYADCRDRDCPKGIGLWSNNWTLDVATNGGHPVKGVHSPWEVQQWHERDAPTLLAFKAEAAKLVTGQGQFAGEPFKPKLRRFRICQSTPPRARRARSRRGGTGPAPGRAAHRPSTIRASRARTLPAGRPRAWRGCTGGRRHEAGLR
jgi:hypothetical protein